MYIFDSIENGMDELNGQIKNNITVIFFLADWCKHCNDFKPDLNDIMSSFKKSKLNGVLAKVEQKHIDSLEPKRKINTFPTISIYKNGKYKEDYTGTREPYSLKQYLLETFKNNKKKNNISRAKNVLSNFRRKRSMRKNKKKSKKAWKNLSLKLKNITNKLKSRKSSKYIKKQKTKKKKKKKKPKIKKLKKKY